MTAARWSNLQVRIVSAVVLAAVVLAVTWIGGAVFRLLSAAIALAILFEWTSMTQRTGSAVGPPRWLPGLFGLAVAAPLSLGVTAPMILALIAAGAIALAIMPSPDGGASRWAAAGFLYASLAGLSLAALRGDDTSGLHAVLFLFAIVWATDVFAYFVGRAFCGPKLAPAISPGKTWSGAIGGAVFGVAAGVAVAVAVGSTRVALLGVIAALISVVSQAGDLFESWVKRRNGAKDSGRLIPGHGGVMDRVDGLVAAAFVFFVVGSLIEGIERPVSGLFPA